MLAYQRVNGPTVRSRVFPMFVVKSHWSRVHPSIPKHFKCCFVSQWGCIWNMPSRYLKSDILYSNKQIDAQAHTHIYICIYIYVYYLTYIYIIQFIRFGQDSSPLIPVSSGRSQSSSCCHGRQNFQRQKTPRLQVGPKYPKIPKISWLAVIFPDKLQCWWYCILLFMQLF